MAAHTLSIKLFPEKLSAKLAFVPKKSTKSI